MQWIILDVDYFTEREMKFGLNFSLKDGLIKHFI
jgi:hypothetical protein